MLDNRILEFWVVKLVIFIVNKTKLSFFKFEKLNLDISGAAGLKSGQFNQQETVPFWRSFILVNTYL